MDAFADNLVEVDSLTKVYPNGTTALSGVSFPVGSGEFVVIVGRSGAGKSTLLRCINGLGEEDRRTAIECLGRVGLGNLAYQRADTLSGGQQQRVSIARALAQRPTVILADEPVASLDPESARIVMDTLRSLSSEEGIAVLCNLHQVNLADRYADRVLGVREGRLVLDGRAVDLGPDEIEAVYGSAVQEAFS